MNSAKQKKFYLVGVIFSLFLLAGCTNAGSETAVSQATPEPTNTAVSPLQKPRQKRPCHPQTPLNRQMSQP